MLDWIFKLRDRIANSDLDYLGFRQQNRYRGPTTFVRGRIPDSNRAERERDGAPHGYPGAKLARRAMEGRVTLR